MDEHPQSAGPLRRELRGLKERGCTLLVVEDVRGVETICHRLGGHDGTPRRRCYVPITTTVASVLARHAPGPRRGEYLGIVDATGAEPTRATASPLEPGQLDVNADWYTSIDDLDDIGELGRQIETHFDRFVRSAGEPAPGEIRLCVESLDPFFDRFDPGATAEFETFLHDVSRLVRERRAIAHFHVAPGTVRTHEEVETSFDATVQVRTDEDGTVTQRWTIHESGIETGWLPLARETSLPEW